MSYGSISSNQPNTYFMETKEQGMGNVDLSQMQYPSDTLYPTQQSYPQYPPQNYPPQIIDVVEYPPRVFNDNTPLIDAQVPSPFVPTLLPNIVGALFFGLVVILTLVGFFYFESYVFGDASVFLMTYPLTFIAVVHFVALLLFLPGVVRSCYNGDDARTYMLPWALVAEVLFVGYFCLLWFVMRQSCEQNLCEVTFALHPILIALISLPWANERIDIAGSVAAIVLTVASGLLLFSNDNGWDWSIYQSRWTTLLASFGMAIVFAFYIVIQRKSTSHPTTGYYQVLFMHIIFGLTFSFGAALGLEVFNDLHEWVNFYSNIWSTDLIWRILCLIAMGILYKVALVLTSRFSETHTTGFAVQIGLLAGSSINTVYTLFPSYLDWISSHPTRTAGFCLLVLSFVYWLVRVFMLHYMHNHRKGDNEIDDSGVLLETYSPGRNLSMSSSNQ